MASSKTVLLAEDEPNIVQSLTFLLERAGFEVCAVGDGRTALARVIQDRPAMLILDVMLPELDGYEVLRKLRDDERTKHLPILMLTAKTQREDRQTAIDCGADMFMTKPFANSEVVAAVERLTASPD
jgi:DNA-binding response OmpR family regulator